MAERQNVASARRLVERNRRARNWERSAFPTSTAGLVRPPSPFLVGGGLGNGQGGEIALGVPPIGELIRCAIAGDIGSGGANVIFNSAQIQLGFDGQTLPSPQLLLPHTAIYGIEGELVYEPPFKSGGVVSLRINDGEFFEIGGFNQSWTRFSIAEEFYANAGDFLSIKVTHNDTTVDGEIGGFLTCATKEPLALSIPEPPEIIADDFYLHGGGTVVISSATFASDFDLQDGDLMVAVCTPSGGSGGDLNCSNPAGSWTKHIQKTTTSPGDEVTVAIFSKAVSGGSVPATTFDWDGTAIGMSVYMYQVRGSGPQVVATDFDLDDGTLTTSLSIGPFGSNTGVVIGGIGIDISSNIVGVSSPAIIDASAGTNSRGVRSTVDQVYVLTLSGAQSECAFVGVGIA